MIEQKKKLRLDDLQVESFVTTDTSSTVGGTNLGDTGYGTCLLYQTQCVGQASAVAQGCPTDTNYPNSAANNQLCFGTGSGNVQCIIGGGTNEFQCPTGGWGGNGASCNIANCATYPATGCP
jgi:hypothetical protein